MTKVVLDTSPLASGHAHRGIGMYTRQLMSELEEIPELEVERITAPQTTSAPPDLIHYPYFDLFFSTLPWRRPAPTIVTVHDVIPLLFPQQYKPGIRGTMRFWRQRATLQKVQAVITDSEASKRDIIKYLKIPAQRIHVIYLAASSEFAPSKPEYVKKVLKRQGLPAQYILYVGDINYNKNIPQLIKSLKYLPAELHLVCVGKNFSPQDIPEWQWIETQIALSDVAHRVHFVPDLGGGDTKELAALYSGAVAYVQPSLAEGFGLPVLEALQCGTPVVCSQNSSLTEIGGPAAVFVEATCEKIADGVNEVLAWTKTKRSAKVKQGRQWAASFTWKRTAKQTNQVYQQVLTAARK